MIRQIKCSYFLMMSLLLNSTLAFSQITFRGCETLVLGPQDFILNTTGTTNDAGTIRNTFESTPSDFGQSCPAGVCELRLIWSISNARWEIQIDNDGPLGNPNYTTAVLYSNATASFPNPPDLSLGSWIDSSGLGCGSIISLSGDVQNSVSIVTTIPMSAGVGIGTSSPQSTLDVNGGIRSLNRDNSGTLYECNSTIEGTFGYDTVDRVLKVCTLNSGVYEWRTLQYQ